MKWITALAGFLVLLSSCSKPQSPSYHGYEDFRIEKVGVKNTVVSTRVKLYNPNGYPLKLKEANIDVYLNDSYLGHSSIDSLITLPGKDTTLVPLQLTASAKDLLSNTLKVWLNPEVKVKITGAARAGRGSLFINVPINYEGVQRIQL
ncbi:MAG: LEA type 2 family protein [Bacteroidota bacterium]|nr:LEA type 2 family protein [Bacteroidota bacterium]